MKLSEVMIKILKDLKEIKLEGEHIKPEMVERRNKLIQDMIDDPDVGMINTEVLVQLMVSIPSFEKLVMTELARMKKTYETFLIDREIND